MNGKKSEREYPSHPDCILIAPYTRVQCLHCAYIWEPNPKKTPPGTRPTLCPRCKSLDWFQHIKKHGTSLAQKRYHAQRRKEKFSSGSF